MVAIEDTRKSKTSLWRSLWSHRRRPFLDIFHSILSFSLLEQEENSLILVDFLLYSIGLQISKRIQDTIDVSKRYVPRFKKKRKEKKSENEKRFERKNFRRGIKLPLWEHGGAWRQGSSDFYRDDPGGNNASYHQLLHVPPRTPTRAPSLRMQRGDSASFARFQGRAVRIQQATPRVPSTPPLLSSGGCASSRYGKANLRFRRCSKYGWFS